MAPADAILSELVAALQDQLVGAQITGYNSNKTPEADGGLSDVIELTFRLDDHAEPLQFRTPYRVLYGGGAVPDMNRYVENLRRIYALPGGPGVGVPGPGEGGAGGALPPGPVLP